MGNIHKIGVGKSSSLLFKENQLLNNSMLRCTELRWKELWNQATRLLFLSGLGKVIYFKTQAKHTT